MKRFAPDRPHTHFATSPASRACSAHVLTLSVRRARMCLQASRRPDSRQRADRRSVRYDIRGERDSNCRPLLRHHDHRRLDGRHQHRLPWSQSNASPSPPPFSPRPPLLPSDFRRHRLRCEMARCLPLLRPVWRSWMLMGAAGGHADGCCKWADRGWAGDTCVCAGVPFSAVCARTSSLASEKRRSSVRSIS